MDTKRLDYQVSPGGFVRGTIVVPGDKSISHRAVMLASIAQGTSRLRGLLEGEDVLHTIAAFRQLGVHVVGPEQGACTITGAGPGGLQPSDTPIDLGNSGTAMRLLMGLLAGQGIDAQLVGDESLSRRPMERVAEPLRRMGADISTSDSGTPPVTVHGAGGLRGIKITLPVASAQVKSAILLAGLTAHGKTCVTEPAPTRDHTERMLSGFGVACERRGATICIDGGGSLQATDIDVPGDLSSAAFFLVGGLLAAEGEVRLPAVGVNPTRTGIIEILRAMGAQIVLDNPRTVCGEPLADLVVSKSALSGHAIDPRWVPLAIDEFPILCVAAAVASGRTVIRGAEELRHKESDRIAVMAQGLHSLGIAVEELPDGMMIDGGRVQGGTVDSHGDHRVAMAFAIAGLVAEGPVVIQDCANIATSFPRFYQTARQAGLRLDG